MVIYNRRLIDDLLDEVFPDLAAIALEGAKGVGKTATAAQRARSVMDLSLPKTRESAEANWNLVTELDPPVLVDEWQLVPSVWDRVRRAVDDDPAGGRFLLTGSAGIAPGVRVHSGAGRIISLRMRPLSMAERGVEEPSVSLSRLLAGDAEIRGQTEFSIGDYVDEVLNSGFPGIRNLSPRARDMQLTSYVERLVSKELPANDFLVRRPGALKQWLTAYAAATSTNASYNAILDAATGGESEKPTKLTTLTYRDQLERLFILDPVEAWLPTFNPLGRLTQAPKHHLVDPALAARLVGVGRAGLLVGEGTQVSPRTGTWLGALFESLATQSVRVYADAADAVARHLRTHGGRREIDLIIERRDGSVLAIEVKLAGGASDSDVRHLNWLKDQIGDRLIDRVVLTTGQFAYRRDSDGVAVVPLALLGP